MIFVIPNPLNTLTIIQVTKNRLNERKEMFVHLYIWTNQYTKSRVDEDFQNVKGLSV